MMRISRVTRYLLLGSFVSLCTLNGCTKRPNEEELARLEEAKSAAESAERKLAELRGERMQLESQLQSREAELKNHEEELEELKGKMGK